MPPMRTGLQPEIFLIFIPPSASQGPARPPSYFCSPKESARDFDRTRPAHCGEDSTFLGEKATKTPENQQQTTGKIRPSEIKKPLKVFDKSSTFFLYL